MLKKTLFSPARPDGYLLHPPALSLPRQPFCPGTPLLPCVVLASNVSSHSPFGEHVVLAAQGGRGGKGYASGAFIGCGLADRTF